MRIILIKKQNNILTAQYQMSCKVFCLEMETVSFLRITHFLKYYIKKKCPLTSLMKVQVWDPFMLKQKTKKRVGPKKKNKIKKHCDKVVDLLKFSRI